VETLLCIREQSLSHGASQSAVRRCWLSLCTVWPSHSQWLSEQISFITTMCLPILQLLCRLFFDKVTHHPGLSATLQPRYGSLQLLAFLKSKIAVERKEICECDGHTVHKLSQWRLTADWLAPQDSDCSWVHSKVSSDRVPSYIKAMWSILEIFKIAGYFSDSPHIHHHARWITEPCLGLWCAAGRSSLIQSL
jgi:hypothetical protein